MKHSIEELEIELGSLLAASDLNVPLSIQRDMLRYLGALLVMNESINLTRVTDPKSAVQLHLLDSVTALPELLDAPSGVMLDLGSGGGFPGVPLALATGRKTVLLDSVAKKGVAVERVLESTLGTAGIAVCDERAEIHATKHRGEYAVVVARAVAPLSVLFELASPLLKQGGVLVALKGDPDSDEIAAGARVARLVGFGEPAVRAFELAGGGECRTIVSAVKTRASSVALPRRDGLARKCPLV